MLVVAACGWGGEAGLSVRRAIRAQKLGQAHALYTKAQHAPAGLHTARHAAPLACDGSRLRSVGGVRAFLPEVGDEAMVPTAVEIAGEIAGETAGESSASPSEPRTSTRSVVAQSTGQRPKRTRSCPQCPPLVHAIAPRQLPRAALCSRQRGGTRNISQDSTRATACTLHPCMPTACTLHALRVCPLRFPRRLPADAAQGHAARQGHR